MSNLLLSALIHLLGFVGLGAVVILPLRSWLELRRLAMKRSQATGNRAIFLSMLVVTSAALWSELQILRHLFNCLTGEYCGPNVGIGWSYLATLGAIYALFEMLVLTTHAPLRSRG